MGVTIQANPFYSRGCIEQPELFCGRQQEIREIFRLLGKSTPQSVSLVGQRKIGKSSLLRHLSRPEVLHRHLERPDQLILTYLNFEELAYYSEIECLQKILWEVQAAIAMRGIPIGQAYKVDLMLATPRRMIQALGRTFRYLAAENRKLVFLFDQFEVFCGNPHLSVDFFNTLRSFATGFGVAYVVASKQELFRLPIYRRGRSSPFFNYFTTLYLGLFTPPEARDLIVSLSARSGVSLEEEADFIMGRAGLFPLFLQSLCWHLWEAKAEFGVLGESERRQAARLSQEQAAPHFGHFWASLSEPERGVALKLALQQPADWAESAWVSSLERKALVSQWHGSPRLLSPALADYVKEVTAQ